MGDIRLKLASALSWWPSGQLNMATGLYADGVNFFFRDAARLPARIAMEQWIDAISGELQYFC